MQVFATILCKFSPLPKKFRIALPVRGATAAASDNGVIKIN